ncbi:MULTISPECIES: lytic transglycosylase domain-containing protein [unclassified Kitasatospora]|uniref:lytic transglycosylase domain-containing protein n=1 Tax=unclassified Kitasatospora TaxID=2633591 RepID=UPI002476E517|nr:lytic transglycosylase domain-containing protein [Kitasatospora sp. GAS204B]
MLFQTAGVFVALAGAAAPSAPLTFASPVAFGAPATAAGGATTAGQPPLDGGGPRPLPQPPATVAGSPFAAPSGTPTGTPTGTPSAGPVSPAMSLSVDGPRLPATVFAAYRNAEASLARTDPGCHLPWQLLAGIGQVESGQADGGRVDAAGTTYTPILGPALDGTNGFAAIPNAVGGTYDGSGSWARAVGPMQFLPSTWAEWGADGNGDGKADPNNVWDAAMAAGRYLCADGRDLSVPAQLDRAVLGYNNSTDYLNTVKSWMAYYRTGASTVPDLSAGPGPVAAVSTASGSSGTPGSSPVPGPVAVPTTAPPATAAPTAQPSATASPTTTPSATPSATATATATATASPSPSAKPSPTPTATASPSPSAKPSPTPTASPTATPSPTPTACPSPTAGASASPSPSTSTSPTASPSPSATPTPTPSASATPGSPAPSGTPTPSCESPSPTAAAPTSSPSPSPSATAR